MRNITLGELRHHPMRFLAPIVAIVLSLGFVVGISVFIETSTRAMAQLASPQVTRAQLEVIAGTSPNDGDRADLKKVIADTPGVVAVTEHMRGWDVVKNELGNQFTQVYATPPESFRWSNTTAGSWPVKADEIALSKATARELQAQPGDAVQLGETTMTVSGITDDASALGQATVYVAPAYTTEHGWQGTLPVQIVASASPTEVAAAIEQRVNDWYATQPAGDVEPSIVVQTAEQVREQALKDMARSNEAMKLMLMGFAAVAVLVGMIIISNTFTILLAQRRRQIGLIRAIGATGQQVRRGFLIEAVVIGLIGALGGIALGTAVAAIAAKALDLGSAGLAFKWLDLVLVVVGGVAVTVLAANLPSRRATLVAPLEALRPAATVEKGQRIGLVRLVICAALIAAGGGLVVLSLQQMEQAMFTAIGAGALISIGVLGLAPLYVPALLRLAGVVLRPFGATANVAVANAGRNPKRSAATATAVMLAVGLIVTLQVATASVSRTAAYKLAEKYPVDLALKAHLGGGGLSDADLRQADSIRGVKKTVALQGETAQVVTPAMTKVGGVRMDITVMSWNDDIPQVAAVTPTPPADNELLAASGKDYFVDGETATVTVNGQAIELTVRTAKLLDSEAEAIVSPATLAKLAPKAPTQALWIDIANDAPLAQTYEDAMRVADSLQGAYLTGGFLEAAQMDKVLDMLLNVMTALLAVAVVVALVGVSNTLSLSVLERTRESALLRAMGMQRGSLRAMLLIEALMLGGVGVFVGIVAGVFFGWLGTAAALRSMQMTGTRVMLDTNWPQTLALVAVALGAAALASVLPGRRAAMATPVEALGVE